MTATVPVDEAPPRRRVGEERLPVPVLILAIAAICFFALPFLGLLWKAPWGDVWSILTSHRSLVALRLSLWCSFWAAFFAIVFGVPLAWLLARVVFRGRSAVRALCTLSMVLPPVVAGVALFYALGRRGLVGQYLDRWFGITLPFTTAGVIVAQTFVAMPFLVLTVEAAFRQVDTRYEDAGADSGRLAVVRVSQSDVAGDPARAHRRGSARMGARARRVRRDDHVRRKLPWPNPDDAARHLPRERDQS